jgi:hypothetical protein
MAVSFGGHSIPNRMLEKEMVSGPALLAAKDTTIVVPVGYSAEMSTGGYLLITSRDYANTAFFIATQWI